MMTNNEKEKVKMMIDSTDPELVRLGCYLLAQHPEDWGIARSVSRLGINYYMATTDRFGNKTIKDTVNSHIWQKKNVSLILHKGEVLVKGTSLAECIDFYACIKKTYL